MFKHLVECIDEETHIVWLNVIAVFLIFRKFNATMIPTCNKSASNTNVLSFLYFLLSISLQLNIIIANCFEVSST